MLQVLSEPTNLQYDNSMTNALSEHIMIHTAKIAISIEAALLKRLDGYIDQQLFKNRSQAIQNAVNNMVEDLEHKCLAIECAKLDRNEEQVLAEEWLAGEQEQW